MTITLKNSGWFILIGILLAVGVYGVTTITDNGINSPYLNTGNVQLTENTGQGLRIITNNTNNNTIVDRLGRWYFYGHNHDDTASTSTEINFINNRSVDQTVTSGNRSRVIEVNWWSGENDNNDHKALSISTHRRASDYPNSGQPNHVSFYQTIMNGTQITNNNKAFEWLWGEDADGVMKIGGAYIQLLEQWKGYYYNETNTEVGIKSASGDINILLDTDADDGSNTFSIYENADSVASANNIANIRSSTTQFYTDLIQLDDGNGNTGDPIIELNDRAEISYNGSNSALELRGLSGKGVYIQTNGGNDAVKIDTQQNVTIPELSGSGNDYVCVDANGKLFRSNAAC